MTFLDDVARGDVDTVNESDKIIISVFMQE